MARLRWETDWHWFLTGLVGAWTAFFLTPAPTPWAWLVLPLAMFGTWLLRSRPAAGASVILLADLVSGFAGVEYGRIELALSTIAALYLLARSRTTNGLDLVFLAGFIGATMLRDGAGLQSFAAIVMADGIPWLFGLVVGRRAASASRLEAEAERLAAIDLARAAREAAAAERKRVVEEAIATLRGALDEISTRAVAAAERPTDTRIRLIQDAARTAIDQLHATLQALGATPRSQPRIRPRHPRVPAPSRRLLEPALAVLGTLLMLVAAELLGGVWLRPVSLIPALILPAAALLAPRIPIIASVAAAGALLVALLATPHPPEALVPILLPLASLCWRVVLSPSRYRFGGIAILAPVWMLLAAQHGREGVGAAAILLALGVFGGFAWANKDALRQCHEVRAAKFTARLAATKTGAAREERRHLARELHDVVSHAVASVTLQAEVARIHLDRRPDRSQAAIASVLAVARGTSAELDAIAGRLGRALARFDLRHLVEGGCRLGLRVHADLDRHALHDELAYRVVQEGLTNAARHAPGSAVAVAVTTQDARRCVVVRNGASPRGEAVAAGVIPNGSGAGLPGIEARVADAGGSVVIGPTREGFELSASWPLPLETTATARRIVLEPVVGGRG